MGMDAGPDPAWPPKGSEGLTALQIPELCFAHGSTPASVEGRKILHQSRGEEAGLGLRARNMGAHAYCAGSSVPDSQGCSSQHPVSRRQLWRSYSSSRRGIDIHFDLSNHKDVLSFPAKYSLDTLWVD